MLVIEPDKLILFISKLPLVPENTSDVFVADVKKVKSPVESSNPKNPSLAVDPSWYLNSIPLSLLSSDAGAVSPPKVNTGSSTVTVFEFTVVVVPLTVKSPVTSKSPEVVTVTSVASPIVTSLVIAFKVAIAVAESVTKSYI